MESPAVTTPFQHALDIIEQLPVEDQTSLIEIIQRRAEIARNARATLLAFREGRAHYGTLQDLQLSI